MLRYQLTQLDTRDMHAVIMEMVRQWVYVTAQKAAVSTWGHAVANNEDNVMYIMDTVCSNLKMMTS